MFDVSWNDHTQETVGQRKNRKDQQTNGVSRGSSVRSAGSSASRASKGSKTSKGSDSSGASKPSLFGLFGSNKKSGFGRSGSQSRAFALRPDPNTKASRRISSYAPSEPSSPRTHKTKSIPENDDFTLGNLYDSDTAVSSPTDGSMFSGWTERSTYTDSSWSSVSDPQSTKGSIIQPLSRTSFITQSTEVTISPRESVSNAAEQLATVVHISAAGTIPIQLNDSPSTLSPTIETFDFPVPKSQLAEISPTPVLRDDVAVSAEGWSVVPRGRQQYSWRPPDTWDVPSESTKIAKSSTKTPATPSRRSREKTDATSLSKLTDLQKKLRKMEAASPEAFVERLKEEWIEVVDASVYRDLELEKQLWVLSALRSLEKKHAPLHHSKDLEKSSSTPNKLLSLYEKQASASFLAATSPITSTIHHLSPNPLSPTLYPNIHPLTTPTPTPKLPYASNLFTSIHSLHLPSLLPSSTLPTVLKDIHRCLRSGAELSGKDAGTLHLTILDPNPLSGTLGPRLRKWLETHLLLNLERQFRCINPSRLFPNWLADAGLRGDGSTICVERFLAAVRTPAPAWETQLASLGSSVDGSVLKDGEGGNGKQKGKEAKDEIKQELKSHVGRMLWKEIWGGFVEGEKWWWEDEKVVEECERLKTGWEYAVIVAVKES